MATTVSVHTRQRSLHIMLLRTVRLASLALSTISPASVVEAFPKVASRQAPANASGVTTITSPTGAQIRYKQPGEAGVCETTPGVKSYSGYIDLSPTSHTFFWFFEARHNPSTAPLTLWLNGGPGSDSLIGLFQGMLFVKSRTILYTDAPIESLPWIAFQLLSTFSGIALLGVLFDTW